MIAAILAGIGCALVAIGTLGILRFGDLFSRLQASGVSDNAGLGVLLVSLMVRGGWGSEDWGLLILLALLLLTNPIATHSIAKSAFTQGYRQDRP